MKWIVVFGFILFPFFSFGTVRDTIYINRGTFTAVDGMQFPYLAYNTTPVFSQVNAILPIEVNDSLIITIINNDTAAHGFKIENPLMQLNLAPQDTITDTLIYNSVSIHAFFDPTLFPNAKNAGLSGVICVMNNLNDDWYVWNLKDHQSDVQTTITANGTNDWSQYLPDYFTINEKSYADIQLDTISRIEQNVGDTIYIFVVNAGQSMHSLHFHGFHPEAVYTEAKKIQPGWKKDTWGMFSMDAMVLKMIPDKAGQYSVHDHNLVALSAGSTHPNGMFTIMLINP